MEGKFEVSAVASAIESKALHRVQLKFFLSTQAA